jgi:CelD/BcsL family acetyltransferase involved in cellulose biosynthesis
MYQTTIASLDDLKKMRDAWNALLLKMDFPTVFLAWEWIDTWWEYFGGEGRELVILTVTDQGVLKGILPLYAAHAVFRHHWLTGRVLTFCTSEDLYPDHLDIISAPEDSAACLDSVFRFLSSKHLGWDVMRVPMVTETSRLAGWLKQGAVRSLGLDFDLEPASIAPYISLNGVFEDYLGRFDSKQRYNIRSRKKKLYDQRGFYYAACKPDSVECLHNVFDLHHRRAQRKKYKSTFTDSRILAFHESLARRIADRGWISLRTIRKDSEVIAASYNFDISGRNLSYQKGIDPAWERFSPGKVLMYELIQEAYAKGLREYNFLQGNESYKRMWAKEYRTLFNSNVYNSTFLGSVARNSYCLKRALKKRLRPRSDLMEERDAPHDHSDG